MVEQEMTAEKFAPLNLAPDELVEYTPNWSGDRFDDGRPRVPDGIIERMRQVTITQAWGVLRNEGYHWQYKGDWKCTHPGQALVGRDHGAGRGVHGTPAGEKAHEGCSSSAGNSEKSAAV